MTNSSDDVVGPLLEGETVMSEAADQRLEVVNPSTGQRIFSIPIGCGADVDKVVASARRAFDDGRWSDLAPSKRKECLHRFADLIEENADALDALDAAEMGKPISEPYCDASSGAGLTRFYAEAVDKLEGDTLTSDKFSFVAQRWCPRGVVAAIVPWNFPSYCAALKVAPTLAAGNTIVLKPSELSSRSAIRLAQLALEAGIPAGVFNVIPGLGQSVGRALGLHHDVDMLTFTGSTSVGKLMLQYAGQSNMKLVMAECGGKSPQIVFADGVDLDAAGEVIARELLTNQGQICAVGSRVLVQKSIEAELLDRILVRLRQIKIGSATDPTTTFGPVASARQCARVMEFVTEAQTGGAQLLAGGKRTRVDSGGFFVEPTVFRNVAPTQRIAQEEIFGPVVSVITFDTEDEAVRLANGTIYGLPAYVWTARLSTAMRMARGIRSSVLINAAAPTGEGPGHGYACEPARQSGIGVEGGLAGMETYLRRQLTWFNHD